MNELLALLRKHIVRVPGHEPRIYISGEDSDRAARLIDLMDAAAEGEKQIRAGRWIDLKDLRRELETKALQELRKARDTLARIFSEDRRSPTAFINKQWGKQTLLEPMDAVLAKCPVEQQEFASGIGAEQVDIPLAPPGPVTEAVVGPSLATRINRAKERLGKVCSEQMFQLFRSIPARPNVDDDLVIADGLDAGKEALDRLSRVGESFQFLEHEPELYEVKPRSNATQIAIVPEQGLPKPDSEEALMVEGYDHDEVVFPEWVKDIIEKSCGFNPWFDFTYKEMQLFLRAIRKQLKVVGAERDRWRTAAATHERMRVTAADHFTEDRKRLEQERDNYRALWNAARNDNDDGS